MIKNLLLAILIIQVSQSSFAKLVCQDSPSGEYCFTPDERYNDQRRFQEKQTKLYTLFNEVAPSNYSDVLWQRLGGSLNETLRKFETVWVLADEVPRQQAKRFINRAKDLKPIVDLVNFALKILPINEGTQDFVSSDGPKIDQARLKSSQKLTCLRQIFETADHDFDKALFAEELEKVSSQSTGNKPNYEKVVEAYDHLLDSINIQIESCGFISLKGNANE